MGRSHPPWFGHPTSFCFVLLEDAQLKIWISNKTTKDIDLMGIPCLGGEKKTPSSS